jgi:hypothetical protein
MIGEMLSDKTFTASILRRIVARMSAIRDMSNLGPHGGEVDATDALRVMRDLIDVLEWYVVNYDPSCLVPGSREACWSALSHNACPSSIHLGRLSVTTPVPSLSQQNPSRTLLKHRPGVD